MIVPPTPPAAVEGRSPTRAPASHAAASREWHGEEAWGPAASSPPAMPNPLAGAGGVPGGLPGGESGVASAVHALSSEMASMREDMDQRLGRLERMLERRDG